MELVAILTIVAGFGSLGVAAVIGVVHWLQHRRCVKATSADNIRWMLERWTERNDSNLRDFLDLLSTSEVEKSDPYLPQFLSMVEDIAIFWNEGTITNDHVERFFGITLKHANTNQGIWDYLKEESKRGTRLYPNLRKLLEASSKWST